MNNTSPTPRSYRRFLKPLSIIAGVVVTYIGVVGFAHTPKGRPLLPYLGLQYFGSAAASAMCPVGGKDPSPERLEAQRVNAMQTMRGTGLAPSNQVLGFTLEKTQKSEVLAWAAASHIACKLQVSEQALDCSDVHTNALPRDSEVASAAGADRTIDSLFMRFRPDGVLVGIDAMLTDSSGNGQRAAEHYAAASQDLASRFGAPNLQSAQTAGSTDELLAKPFSQRQVVYRYENLAVDVRLLSTSGGRLMWRAQYRSVPRV